ncbi:MAG: sugar phosphate isomerase/epimerase [Alphaproteobacteria bacterium]
MQKLEVFQSVWAMERRALDGMEWSLAEQVEMLKAAGYDGMDLLTGRPDQCREAAKLLQAQGLANTGCAFPKSVEGLQADIDVALEIGATHLNIIGQVFPFTVEEGADVIRAWLDMCDAAAMPAMIETHRDCITTDFYYMLQLMEAVPHMPVCADLSHYVVGREFDWPISDLNNDLVGRILDCAVGFQGRVASREQIQLQISFPHHKEWFDLFLGWWERGFRAWRARAPEGAALNFLCELGPKEYAITGPDGEEQSDRWEEALVIKDHVRAIWERLDSEDS